MRDRRRKKARSRRTAKRAGGSAHALRAPALAVFAAGVLAGGALAVDGGPGELASQLSSYELRITLPRAELPELPPLPPVPELPEVGAPLRAPRFAWRRVDFTGLQRIPAQKLLARVMPDRPVALIDVDTGALCDTLSRHRRVARCTAMRLPPDRVLVDLAERVPVALAGPGQGIDAEGVRFPIAPAEARGLPRVSGAARPALGLVLAARQADVALARVSGGPRDELLFEPAGRGVRVRAAGDPRAALAGWRRIDESGLVAGRGAGEVDLRFRGRAVLRDFRD